MEIEHRQFEPEKENNKSASLRELVNAEVDRRRSLPGARVSERVVWLSQEIEAEDFWMSLNNLMAQDIKTTRQSVGGIFTRESGKERVGPCSWQEVFSSLDVFLRQYDTRAIEYIFRDFAPVENDRNLIRLITATRQLAFEKYPRLRKIYWEDYREILEIPSFWRSLHLDVSELTSRKSSSAFFDFPKRNKKAQETHLDRAMKRKFVRTTGLQGGRAIFMQYYNLAQIIRDNFHQDAYDFLLSYMPETKDALFLKEVEDAKRVMEEKLFKKKKHERVMKISERKFQNVISGREFWENLYEDMLNHRNSDKQAFSLSSFLGHYSRDVNNIVGRGDYLELVTNFMNTVKRYRRKIPQASKKLSTYLMWKFEPGEELVEYVSKVKELCFEMFPQDCLYVELQAEEFWDSFFQDTEYVRGKPNFYSFLRYFSKDNRNCDGREHTRGKAKYQRFLHRAYHEQEEFIGLLDELGIENIGNYRDGLIELFWLECPEKKRYLLHRYFPNDFNPIERERKKEDRELLLRMKRQLGDMADENIPRTVIQLDERENAARVRKKLWSAARTLQMKIKTSLSGATLTVEIGSGFVVSKEERPNFEESVRILRRRGLSNEEIARELGVKDHHIEYVVGKLARSGVIFRR